MHIFYTQLIIYLIFIFIFRNYNELIAAGLKRCLNNSVNHFIIKMHLKHWENRLDHVMNRGNTSAAKAADF